MNEENTMNEAAAESQAERDAEEQYMNTVEVSYSEKNGDAVIKVIK